MLLATILAAVLALTPLEVLNGYIVEFIPVFLSAVATAAAAALVPWVLSHIKLKSAQAQQAVANLLTEMLLRGAAFAGSALASNVNLPAKISTGNATVDKIANYAVANSPDLLKKAGIDVTTTDGRQKLARRIVATVEQAAPTPTP